MISVDSNILVYAHRADSPWHAAALPRVRQLVEGSEPWVIFWPCIHEFFGIVTSPRVYQTPTPFAGAFFQIEVWLGSPSHVQLAELNGYWDVLKETLAQGQIVGPKVHDARLAALCRQHNIREFWTTDRDFSRFPDLPVRNPLVG